MIKSNWKTLALAAAITALPGAAMAQFDFGGGSGAPQTAWSQFKLDAKKTMQLTFRNASPDSVIELFIRVTGINIVKDPALKDPISVFSAKPVKLAEAFEILNAAVGLRGFDMKKEGNLIVIRKREQRQDRGGMGSFDPSMFSQFTTPQTELKVYRIKFASAADVSRVVNEVFASQQAAQNPFAGFGGGGGGNPFQRGGNQGGRGGGGNPFSRFGGMSMGGQAPTVRASSDDFSNSVIVNAPREKQREVEDFIKEIDKQTDSPLGAKVYKLQFAIASQVSPLVQNLLNANTPTGRGGASNNQPLSQRFNFQSFFSSRQQGAGQVTADDRTNSLIVSATAENQLVVEKIIAELDKDVPVVNTTFVFPLLNARADSVSDLLNQAFGGRTGATNRGGAGRTTANQNRQTTQRNQGGGGNNLGGGGRAEEDPDNINLEVGPDGEVLTDIYVQQGQFRGGFGQFGGGQGGQQNRNNQNTSQLTRTADGRVANSRDLTGQVTVIPDPSTNSLIVVTSPDNLELIKQILSQVDRIPEQVMIETMIVEATLDKSSKMGVEWTNVMGKVLGNSGVTGTGSAAFGIQNATPAREGFRYTLSGGKLSAFINALQTDDKFNVLSTPRIFTSNNVEAEINISQSIPYVLSTRTDTNGAQTFNYAFQDVGIVLNVTPRITANGYVTLDLVQTANDLQGFTDFNAPIVNQRQAETTVSVKDGETVVLGGIMRSVVTSKVKKLPLLGDIPLLGQLFRSTDKQSTKTELMVFMTPRIVRDAEEAEKLTQETVKGLSPGLQQQFNGAKVNKSNGGSSTKTAKGNKKGS